MIAISGKFYSETDFVKQCLVETADLVFSEKAHLFKDSQLIKNAVAARLDVMLCDLKCDLLCELKVVSSSFDHFYIAIDETVEITGIAQLTIFITACDSEFNIYEGRIVLVPQHETTENRYIFERVE